MSMDVETRVGQILALYSGPDTDVARLLCDRHPDEDVALIVVAQDLSVTTVTYGELAESSRRFAAVLRSRGVRPGERVATLMGKGADLVTVILGIWRAGAVYVPLFTAFAEGTIAARLQGAAAKVLVADREQLFKVPEGSWQVLVSGGAPGAPGVDSLDHALAHAPVDPRESLAVGGDGPLVHMFTSGTTSAPKGVVHPVRYAAGWHSYLEFGLGVGEDSVLVRRGSGMGLRAVHRDRGTAGRRDPDHPCRRRVHGRGDLGGAREAGRDRLRRSAYRLPQPPRR